MTPPGTDDLRRILARVPGLDAAGASIAPLAGGLTNRNYRVEAGAEVYALRIGGRDARLLGIDRDHERAASAAAASLGIGAEVVHVLPDADAMLTRFVSGAVLTPADAARPGMLCRIAGSIRRVHDGPPIPGAFLVFDTVRAYHARARDRGARLPARLNAALRRLAAIERAVGRPARLAPCHNDLLAGNFIDDGATIRILDWEYAAQGDPFFDLGNCAANLGLDGDGCARLLAAYAGATRPRDMARVRLLQTASDLRESLWGFLQTRLSALDADYVAYGTDHLDRFLARSATPECVAWLRAV